MHHRGIQKKSSWVVIFVYLLLLLLLFQFFDIGVSFTSKFLPNFNLKNMVSTYIQRVFHWKNGPNLPDFEFPNFQIAKV
jgi:hypothetical protein